MSQKCDTQNPSPGRRASAKLIGVSKRVHVIYDAAETYARLIEPRYRPIADLLLEAAAPRATDRVLELGAGTGLVTRAAAPKVASYVATDLFPAMLERCRARVGRKASYALLDWNQPFPFLDGSFDLVLGGLTYVQNDPGPLGEAFRVLRPGGRLALTMWGTLYQETRMLSDATESIGLPRFPPAAPGRAVRRIERAGFEQVKRRDVSFAPKFVSVDDYLDYRRGFGRPAGWSEKRYERLIAAYRREADKAAAADGSLTLGWNIVVVTAHRPRT